MYSRLLRNLEQRHSSRNMFFRLFQRAFMTLLHNAHTVLRLDTLLDEIARTNHTLLQRFKSYRQLRKRLNSIGTFQQSLMELLMSNNFKDMLATRVDRVRAVGLQAHGGHEDCDTDDELRRERGAKRRIRTVGLHESFSSGSLSKLRMKRWSHTPAKGGRRRCIVCCQWCASGRPHPPKQAGRSGYITHFACTACTDLVRQKLRARCDAALFGESPETFAEAGPVALCTKNRLHGGRSCFELHHSGERYPEWPCSRPRAKQNLFGSSSTQATTQKT